MEIFHAHKHIGKGNEHHCYSAFDRNGEKSAIKFEHLLGKTWRTSGVGYLLKSLNKLDDQGVRRMRITTHNQAIIQMPNGNWRRIPEVQETPFIDDIDNLTVKYSDLTDPETGPDLVRELAQLVKASHEIYEDPYPQGIDFAGGAILKDLVKGLIQDQLLKASDKAPELIRNTIRAKCRGIQGQLRNFILHDDDSVTSDPKNEKKTMLIDHGLYDLSENGKLKWLIGPMYHMVIAGLIQFLQHINAQFPPDKQLSDQELDLPYDGPERDEKWGQYLFNIMTPLFERFEELKNQPITSDSSPHGDIEPQAI